MANVPGSMLLCASSPYSRRGSLWDAHRKHFGRDSDPILVWQASTRTMNETIPQSFIDAELERDHAAASAEYLAQFRTDVEALVPQEVVAACVSRGVRERPRTALISQTPLPSFHGACSGGDPSMSPLAAPDWI